MEALNDTDKFVILLRAAASTRKKIAFETILNKPAFAYDFIASLRSEEDIRGFVDILFQSEQVDTIIALMGIFPHIGSWIYDHELDILSDKTDRLQKRFARVFKKPALSELVGKRNYGSIFNVSVIAPNDVFIGGLYCRRTNRVYGEVYAESTNYGFFISYGDLYVVLFDDSDNTYPLNVSFNEIYERPERWVAGEWEVLINNEAFVNLGYEVGEIVDNLSYKPKCVQADARTNPYTLFQQTEGYDQATNGFSY
ncbi:MAG: hypothetical protein JXR42_00295 [Gammaproteobacteria bacterium]|nr:hypothetical protein [Gammaproteobacteria bacterium]